MPSMPNLCVLCIYIYIYIFLFIFILQSDHCEPIMPAPARRRLKTSPAHAQNASRWPGVATGGPRKQPAKIFHRFFHRFGATGFTDFSQIRCTGFTDFSQIFHTWKHWIHRFFTDSGFLDSQIFHRFFTSVISKGCQVIRVITLVSLAQHSLMQ